MLKKKTLLPLLLCLLLTVSLVGCSSSAKDSASKNSTPAKTEQTVSDKAKTPGSDQAKTTPAAPGADNTTTAPKNEARPGAASGTRIMGQIVSVKDRTVTLALFDTSSGPEAPSGNGAQPSAPTSGAAPPSGGNQPGGQAPQLSGEKKTITIPATIKIYSGGRNSSSEVSITTLKAGQMMEVRLNSSTGAVEEVRIMEPGQGGPPTGGNGPGQAGGAPAN